MEQLVNFVIRPPRAEYDPSRDLLRPEFTMKGGRYKREDLKITNKHGHKLECSHYMPIPTSEEKPLPCVIYCHGNSGCRTDASEAAVILLPSNITVFSLDFSGSGLSEGEYVTLGWNEKDDLMAAVEHLRTDKRISRIGLWGRSMGAVTCLFYGAEDPSIAGMVLDSPFSNLVDLMMELVDVYKVRFPKFTLKVAIQYMRKVIQKKARFDIMDLDTIQVAKRSFIPALFGHGSDDSFIQQHHSDRIYKAYMGDKNIIKFEGDHNSRRPAFYYDSINIFFHNVLQPPEGSIAEVASTMYYDDLGLDEEEIWYQVYWAMQPSFPPDLTGLGPNVTEDESGWRMSRTEVPSDIGDLQEDISKLCIEGSIADEGSPPSSTSQIHQSDGESSMTRLYNDRIGDNGSWYSSAGQSSEDKFAHFPSTAEDEEKMIMEAIALSLQESKVDDSKSSCLNRNAEVNNVPYSPPSLREDGLLNLNPATQNSSGESETESQTIGTLEAFGQRWGLGIFRAMSNKQSDKGQS